MRKNTAFQFCIAAAFCGILTAGCRASKTQNPSSAESAADNAVCSAQYDPVCGADGITYSNECVATQQKNVKIVYRGECVGVSSLKDFERKNLMWLLIQREEAGLPQVNIKHLMTIERSCADCYSIYYTLGDLNVTARLIVESDVISSAIDSLGYDYLDKKQGAPIDFEELDQGLFPK